MVGAMFGRSRGITTLFVHTALTGWLLCAALRGVVGCSVQFRATSTLRTGVSGFDGIPCPSRWTMRCVSTGGIMGRAGAAVSRRSVALV